MGRKDEENAVIILLIEIERIRILLLSSLLTHLQLNSSKLQQKNKNP